MKFTINKTELQNALSIVSKGVSTRSTLPVLAGVLIEASSDSITMETTDLELSIKFSTPALVEEEGKAVLPGKLFSDIVKNMPDAAITVESSEDQAHIHCENSNFNVKILSHEDFPAFPVVEVNQTIEIPFDQFAKMVKRVARIVSKDQSRAILTGVLITVEGDLLRMVSTDSYRLAVTEAVLPSPIEENFSAVIAGTFLSDIASLSRYSKSVQLALSENQIVVTLDNTVFINRRIEGNFPNYRQLLPESSTTQATVSTDQLAAAIRRTSLLGNSSAPVKLDINVASQTIQMSSSSQDVGDAREIIGGDVKGEDVVIAFNSSYVLDGLSSVTTENVHIDVQSSLKPGIFRSEESENYLYLVMPVRIS